MTLSFDRPITLFRRTQSLSIVLYVAGLVLADRTSGHGYLYARDEMLRHYRLLLVCGEVRAALAEVSALRCVHGDLALVALLRHNRIQRAAVWPCVLPPEITPGHEITGERRLSGLAAVLDVGPVRADE